MPPNEHGEQVALVEWMHTRATRYPEIGLLFAIPNGSFRAKSTGARLKAEGVRKGIPDLFLPVARGGRHGLFIELKTREGRASADQINWHGALRAQGYAAAICYGADEAIEHIESYLEIPEADRTVMFT